MILNSKVCQSVKAGWDQWDQFWFRADCENQWRLFRTALGVWGISFYLVRTLDLELFYSKDGMASVSVIQELFPLTNRWSILFLNQSTNFLWLCNVLYLLAFLMLAIGKIPRLSALVAFVLHVSFINRNPATVFGADMIATFYLFYLIAVPGIAPASQTKAKIFSSVAFRFAQIQLCIIYAYSGLEKLKGTHWWRGEALWDIFGNAQLSRFDFGWTSHFPTIIVLASTATLVWEIYFPVLVWVQKLRKPLLIFGVTMHLMIGITMSIPHFSVLMFIIYILFLDPSMAKKMYNSLLFSRSRLSKH